jgi:chaperonin GroEL
MPTRPYKPVVFQPRAYLSLQKGIHQVANAVRPTLGPVPRVVAVELMMRRHLAPEVLDSGAAIAQRIVQLPDRDEDVGAMLIRDTLMRVQEKVGDGTATTAVLLQSIYDGGVRYLAAGGNAMMLRRALHEGAQVIADELDKQVTHPQGEERLRQIAESICYDPPLARMLGEIFDIIGEYGRLEIRASRGRTLAREYVEGMYWSNGVCSREMLADRIRLRTEMENTAILISDLRIEDADQLVPLIAVTKAAGHESLLVIAREFSSSAIALLLANSRVAQSGREPGTPGDAEPFQIVAVKAPGDTPDERSAALLDMVKLTGGQPYLTSTGHQSLRGIQSRHLGRARSAWATTQSFGIVGGKGDPRALRKHIADLRAAYQSAQDVETRKALQERIGKLMGGSARLDVGGLTESAILARRELAERTADAMRGAMVEGILPGGGVALLACRPALQGRLDESTDADERAAYHILLQGLEAPMRTLVANAGHDPSMAMARIAQAPPGHGLDVRSGQVVDMAEAGIYDPAAAIKTAVHAAINSAALALTTDVVIHHLRPPVTSPLYPSYAERQRAAGRKP